MVYPRTQACQGGEGILTHNKFDSEDMKFKPQAISLCFCSALGGTTHQMASSCLEAAVYRSLLKLTVVHLLEQSSRLIKELTNKQWLIALLHAAVVKCKGPLITEQTAPDSLCRCQEGKMMISKFSFREQTAEHIIIRLNQQIIWLLHCTVLCYAETRF